jgi:hypothetical protein
VLHARSISSFSHMSFVSINITECLVFLSQDLFYLPIIIIIFLYLSHLSDQYSKSRPVHQSSMIYRCIAPTITSAAGSPSSHHLPHTYHPTQRITPSARGFVLLVVVASEALWCRDIHSHTWQRPPVRYK